jgi:hypothetical protein
MGTKISFLWPLRHTAIDAKLGSLDAKLEQFPVDAGVIRELTQELLCHAAATIVRDHRNYE